MDSSQFDVACPRCGHDRRVKKVSAKYAEEVGSAPVSSPPGEGYVNRKVSTVMGTRLSPPHEYSSGNVLRIIILVLSTFACGFAAIGTLCLAPMWLGLESNAGTALSLGTAGIAVLILGLWALVNFLVRRSTLKQDRELEPLARRAREKWEKLYYCELHDIAFVPGTDILMPSTEVQKYVDWHAQ